MLYPWFIYPFSSFSMFISLDIVLDTKMFVLEVVSSVLCVGCTLVLISCGTVTREDSPSLSGLENH